MRFCTDRSLYDLILLLGLLLLGGLLLVAAGVLLPYRRRFADRLHRLMFVVAAVATGALGVSLLGGAGFVILLELL